jgi:hypothetical protein
MRSLHLFCQGFEFRTRSRLPFLTGNRYQNVASITIDMKLQDFMGGDDHWIQNSGNFGYNLCKH